MTPTFLKSKIVGIVDTTGTTETELKIGADSAAHEIILEVELLTSGLQNDDDITVVINVATEGPPPSKYDPLAIMITDGDNAMGIQLRDPTEYRTMGPYVGIAGEYGRQLTDIQINKSDELNYKPGDWQRWPQSYQIQLKPNSYWGTCSSPAHGGISLSFVYPKRLRFRRQLSLVLYRGEKSENYTINMIEVSVYKDHA